MKHGRYAIVGLTLMTPALGAGRAAASLPSARIVDAVIQDSGAEDWDAARARLKMEMLSIDPETKLGIAGDRVQLMRLAANETGGHSRGGGRHPGGGKRPGRVSLVHKPTAACHAHSGPQPRVKKTLQTYTEKPAPPPPPPPPPSGCTIWTLG